jgi:hypothetical protein
MFESEVAPATDAAPAPTAVEVLAIEVLTLTGGGRMPTDSPCR